jgi:hypothetical protein
MVFDLVRPLGAKRGEIEINSLAVAQGVRPSSAAEAIEWAPEIEFALRDGLAFELEFPVEGRRLTSYKFAVQGSFRPAENGLQHGWQTIAMVNRNGAGISGDALYLAGARFGRRLSAFSMSGIRTDATSRARTSVIPLQNGMIGYDLKRWMTVACETNFVLSKGSRHRQLVIPQTHVRLTRSSTLQLGIGREWTRANEPTGGHGAGGANVAAIRLVKMLR